MDPKDTPIQNGQTLVIRAYEIDEHGNACLVEHYQTNDPQEAVLTIDRFATMYKEVTTWVKSDLTGRYQRVGHEVFLTECEWLGAEVDWEAFYGPDETEVDPQLDIKKAGFLA